MGTLQIETEQLNGIVAEAVLAQIDEQGKDAILKAAIVSLGRRDTFGSGRDTILENAFNQAVTMAAGKIARELVESDETFQTTIRDAVRVSMEQLLQDSEKLRTAVSEAVAGVIRQVEYR